jgi:hypothetical protein
MATLTDAQRLTAARDALHSLNTGTAARVVVDQNGERVEFNTANADRLRAYIAELETLVATGTRPSRRPMMPFFS